jgi:EAL domain-containing protein (putative c-di-GMP-specific phosphodiesterase class I)
MAFQPIVDVESGRPYAFEALVRGLEGQGARTILDGVNDRNRYAFDQACRVKAIDVGVGAGLIDTGAKLAINFLPNAIYAPITCIQATLRAAEEHDFPADRLIFEFAESEQIVAPDKMCEIIECYREIGFSTALDDFGAGHAGLKLFVDFCTDTLKLDMELVRGVHEDKRRQAVIRSLVSMCADLDTTLIAEGIETREEAETLRALGIRYMQGYLFARPAFEALPEIAFRFDQ